MTLFLNILGAPEADNLRLISNGSLGLIEAAPCEQRSYQAADESHGPAAAVGPVGSVRRANRANRAVGFLHIVGRLAGLVLKTDVVAAEVGGGALVVVVALCGGSVRRVVAIADGRRGWADLYG